MLLSNSEVCPVLSYHFADLCPIQILQCCYYIQYLTSHLFWQVGISATNVARTHTLCVIPVHFHCAKGAVKVLLYFVLEETRAFVSHA